MQDSFIDSVVRKVPDFPKQGILFYDITSILLNSEAFKYCTDKLCSIIQESGAQAIAAIEARGFLFAAPAAVQLGMPLVLIRKKGKLPGRTIRQQFDLEYGSDEIHLQESDVDPGKRIFLVDDLLATGGTVGAAASLVEKAGGSVAGIFAVIGLPFLGYGNLLKKYSVATLHNYTGE